MGMGEPRPPVTEATARRTRNAAKNSAPRPPVYDEPLQALLAAMSAVGEGDFDVRLPGHWEGIEGRLAEAFNAIVAQNRELAAELARVGEAVGRDGQTRQRIAPAANGRRWSARSTS